MQLLPPRQRLEEPRYAIRHSVRRIVARPFVLQLRGSRELFLVVSVDPKADQDPACALVLCIKPTLSLPVLQISI